MIDLDLFLYLKVIQNLIQVKVITLIGLLKCEVSILFLNTSIIYRIIS